MVFAVSTISRNAPLFAWYGSTSPFANSDDTRACNGLERITPNRAIDAVQSINPPLSSNQPFIVETRV